MSETKWNEQPVKDWLSPSEAAELLPGSPAPATVRKWIRAGKLAGVVQMPGGHWQIPASTVRELMGGAA